MHQPTPLITQRAERIFNHISGTRGSGLSDYLSVSIRAALRHERGSTWDEPWQGLVTESILQVK